MGEIDPLELFVAMPAYRQVDEEAAVRAKLLHVEPHRSGDDAKGASDSSVTDLWLLIPPRQPPAQSVRRAEPWPL